MSFLARLGAELATIDGVLQTAWAYRGLKADGLLTIADDIEKSCDRFATRPAFRFEGAEWSYAQFEARANRYAHWALGQGLKRGDVVALFMTNQPDYVACWMGLAKVGVVTALVNSGLVGGPLAHCINISEAKHLIFSADLTEAVSSVRGQFNAQPQEWALEGNLATALLRAPATRPAASHRDGLKSTDLALYVFTSGTTGAPKAARMTHLRVLGMLRAFIGGGHARESDRVYLTLPLYHGTGGLTGVGFALERGGCILLKRKFSASHFWEDCAAENATVFFYIGELCRYLLNAPESPHERAHHLRLGVGNGLRPEVWEAFQARFNVPKMLEFYGSTEGNANLLNFDGKMGAVGRIPFWLKRTIRIRIIKFDVESEQPVRGPDGLCIEAEPDEPGEAIGEILQNQARYKYEGYKGEAAQTEKKVLHDVFAKGDAWFRTGDLLRKDAAGYFYFVDRIGDTFRWKGENVSTNEVADVLSRAPGVTEANVYGVRVPGQDGRAGMAALTTEVGFSLEALHAHAHKELPAFARPLFVRLMPAIETTGTFKYRKIDLVREGVDPALIHEPLYFDDPEARAYTPWSAALMEKMARGEIRV
ncbi:MAG: long-chain-acyl-CoA synthetase [Hyphomonadaceae bacterium]